MYPQFYANLVPESRLFMYLKRQEPLYLHDRFFAEEIRSGQKEKRALGLRVVKPTKAAEVIKLKRQLDEWALKLKPLFTEKPEDPIIYQAENESDESFKIRKKENATIYLQKENEWFSKIRDNPEYSCILFFCEFLRSPLPPDESDELSNIMYVEDDRGLIQAVTMMSHNFTSSVTQICFLFTAPHNIPNRHLFKEKIIRGAPTALIEEVIYTASQFSNQKKTVKLLPSDEAVPYYLHLGFKNEAFGIELVLQGEDLDLFLLNHSGRALSTF